MNLRLALLTCPWIALSFACSETTPSDTLASNTISAPKISVSLDTISDLNGTVGEAKALTDNNGDIVLFWEHYETQEPTDANIICQRTNLMTRRYDSTKESWGDAAILQSGVWRTIARNDTNDGNWKRVSSGINTELRLGVGASDNLFAIWVQDTASDCEEDNDLLSAVYESRYTSSGWSTPATLVDTPIDNVSSPALAVSSQNYALAAWRTWQKVTVTVNGEEIDTGRRISVIEASHFDGVDTWATPFVASDNDGETTPTNIDSDSPVVTINANDYGTLAWRHLNDGVYELHALNYLADSGWNSSSVTVNSSTDIVNEIDITSNQSNKAWLVWTGADSTGVTSVYVNSLSSDDNLGTESSIQGDVASTTEDEREQPASSPRIVADGNSNITVAWKQVQKYNPLDNKWNNSSASTLWSNQLSASDGTWNGAKLIAGDQRSSIAHFSISNIGNIVALTWLQDNDSRSKYPQSIYKMSAKNQSWGTSTLIDDLGNNTTSFDAQSENSQLTSSWITSAKTIDSETNVISAKFAIGISSIQ